MFFLGFELTSESRTYFYLHTKPTESTSNRLDFFWSVCLLFFVEPAGWSPGRPSIRHRLGVGLLTTLELLSIFWLKKAEFGRQLRQLRKVFVRAVNFLCRAPE